MKTLGVILYCAVFFAPIVVLCLLAAAGYDVHFMQFMGAIMLMTIGIIGGAAISEAVQ